jgi:hypothetical protein
MGRCRGKSNAEELLFAVTNHSGAVFIQESIPDFIRIQTFDLDTHKISRIKGQRFKILFVFGMRS